MNIYLPIAEVSVNIFILMGLGGLVGILSGMFGVGGGFLMTPLLFFIGIPPAIAVATESNQIVATSVSGAIAHLKRKALDLKMGMILTSGGLSGSLIGIYIFKFLNKIGQLELIITLCYIIFLGIIGFLMFFESILKIKKNKRKKERFFKKHIWIHHLPLKMRFRVSNLYISAIPPFFIGLIVGILAAIMGVGGGFIMVPAMIYIIGMPTKVVIGTSLFQIIFVTSFTTIMHATQNYSVDIILGFLLIIGGVIGAQIGVRLGVRLKAEQLRVLLSTIVLLVCFKLAYDLFLTPEETFEILKR